MKMEKKLASQHFFLFQISKIKSKWDVRSEGVVSLTSLPLSFTPSPPTLNYVGPAIMCGG